MSLIFDEIQECIPSLDSTENIVEEIATEYGMSESKIKMSLFRSRNELKKLLEKEGISV